jgi:hypothetical protein
MLIKDSTITFNWALGFSAAFATYNEAYFDIQITDPDGLVTYQEGSANWATSFLQPTVDTDGLLTYDITPTKAGVYTIILGTGGAVSFTILDTALALIVVSDLTQTNTIVLP